VDGLAIKDAIMKKQSFFILIVVFVSSLACQFLIPSRTGTVISDCADIVSAVANLQVGDIPQHLFDTGKKQGDEFDVNQYFSVLTHISMQEGYTLDYVYQNDSLGGFPLVYARPADQAPYASVADIPANIELPDFREYLQVEDVEQGYFEFVVLDIMARQFYLFWHANYNDTQIICNRQQVNDIVAQVSSGDFGSAMDLPTQTKARTMRNIEPVVRLTGDIAIVEVVTFTKWGGFYRETYTISRGFPHTILDIKQENVVPYDCGIAF
jgi:hypothetical protein